MIHGVIVPVYQGEGQFINDKDMRLIGKFTIDIKPVPRHLRFKVTMKMNESGSVTIVAQNEDLNINRTEEFSYQSNYQQVAQTDLKPIMENINNPFSMINSYLNTLQDKNLSNPIIYEAKKAMESYHQSGNFNPDEIKRIGEELRQVVSFVEFK